MKKPARLAITLLAISLLLNHLGISWIILLGTSVPEFDKPGHYIPAANDEDSETYIRPFGILEVSRIYSPWAIAYCILGAVIILGGAYMLLSAYRSGRPLPSLDTATQLKREKEKGENSP